MLFPSPLLALLHDDKEVSAILATVLGSLHDNGNSDNVPAKPPEFLRSQNREPRMEGTAEPYVLGPSSIALLDFHRNGLLEARTGCPPSTGLHCSETLWSTEAEKNLLYREWSDCASVSTGCPKRGYREIREFFAGMRTWWAEGKGTR